MAEGLFLQEVQSADLADQIEVDSCGTGGWHVGERPDPRMQETAKRHGVPLPSRGRKVELEDFQTFDYILAMDESNLRELERLQDRLADSKAILFKMRHFDPEAPDTDVPDPYWGGDQGFENVYQMLHRASQALLAYIREQEGI